PGRSAIGRLVQVRRGTGVDDRRVGRVDPDAVRAWWQIGVAPGLAVVVAPPESGDGASVRRVGAHLESVDGATGGREQCRDALRQTGRIPVWRWRVGRRRRIGGGTPSAAD